MTATEIDYPSNGDKINGKDLKLDDQVDTTEFDGVKESRKGNETEVDTSIEDELPAKHVEDVEMYAALPRGRNVISRERELEIQAATMFETINPYFFRILRPYNLSNSLLVLPSKFCRNYLKGLKLIKLQASDGRQWHCQLRGIKGSKLPSRIIQGWRTFCKDNQFYEGDICAFELIRRNGSVLKVFKFPHVPEYAGQLN